MEPRGQGWHMPGHQYQSGDRDDHYRSSHQTPYYYPPSDPREREWPHMDPRYGSYMASPPIPENTPGYSSRPFSSQGFASDQPLHDRPHSRQEYDYSAPSYWPYRLDYGYYNYHGYNRAQYSSPDGGGWSPADGWRGEGYQVRGLHQESARVAYPDQQGYNLRTDGQYGHGVLERQRRESMQNGDGTGEVYDNGALANSKTSGLSSSSYELSQYINGADQSEPEPVSHIDFDAAVIAPLKFCIPHVAVSFGPAGQLVWVNPAFASQGDPAQVEIHSLEVIMCDTEDQQDMRDFPGPLTREDMHKVDAINFALQMSEECLKDQKLEDATSAALLWHLLILLCRQNGRIVGSDVAELLTRDSSSLGVCGVSGEPADEASLIDLSETHTPETETINIVDLLTGYPPTDKESEEQNLEKYTKLLLSGRKKEALESAMQSFLWGHALFLASKMDSRSYNTVLSRFTGSLAPADPLQTLFQLLSGRIPAVSMCWSSEKWGDWRTQLAVMLSNETGDSIIHRRSIITMGDTLASRGLLYASHICYLTAHSPFGWYKNRSERLVLLGSKHINLPFSKFCQNSAIHCTELFEYCQRLGNAEYIIPAFQVYKFLYACRLLDCGLVSQAYHYCEVVAKVLLRIEEPHMVLLEELIKLVERLKLSEAQLRDTGVNQPFLDPDWLVQLRCRHQAMQMENYDCSRTYQSPVVENTCAYQDSNVYSDSQTEAINHEDTEDDFSYPSQPMIPHNDALHQKSYTPVSHSHSSEEQAPKTVAPVPLYPTQQPMTLPPVFPMQTFEPLRVSMDQSNTNPDSSPNYDIASSSLPQRSYRNTGLEYSVDGVMQGAPENNTIHWNVEQSGTIPSEDDKREANTQSAKSSKSAWFSGWFKSKPKEIPKEQMPDSSPTSGGP